MKMHRFDSVSFIAGVVALVLGIALVTGGPVEDQAIWAVPLLLGISGLVVIGKTIDRYRKSHSEA